MKIRLYLDIWPGIDPKFITASATAYSKPSEGTTRYAVDIVIPDPNRPDAVAEVEGVEEVTKRFITQIDQV